MSHVDAMDGIHLLESVKVGRKPQRFRQCGQLIRHESLTCRHESADTCGPTVQTVADCLASRDGASTFPQLVSAIRGKRHRIWNEEQERSVVAQGGSKYKALSCSRTCRVWSFHRYHVANSPIAGQHFLELLTAFPSALIFLCLGGRIRMTDNVQRFLPLDNTMVLCFQMHQTIHQMVFESKTANVNLVEAAHLSEISLMVDTLMQATFRGRFLTLWITTLPFALIGTLPKKWLTLAVTMATSYCMLGIEEIGHLIEQPFLGDPLDGEVWGIVDKGGEASPLIKRGLTTHPNDIGIPVCNLVVQIREEVERITSMPSGADTIAHSTHLAS